MNLTLRFLMAPLLSGNEHGTVGSVGLVAGLILGLIAEEDMLESLHRDSIRFDPSLLWLLFKNWIFYIFKHNAG